MGFHNGSRGKESICNAGITGDSGLVPGWGRSPGVRNDNLLQYSCLGNPMDRGAWLSTVHGVQKNWTCPGTHAAATDIIEGKIDSQRG